MLPLTLMAWCGVLPFLATARLGNGASVSVDELGDVAALNLDRNDNKFISMHAGDARGKLRSARGDGGRGRSLTSTCDVYATKTTTCLNNAELRFVNTGGQLLLNGETFQLKGANWSGFETTQYVANGMTFATVPAIVNFLADMGFNAIRIPISLQLALNPYTTVNPDFCAEEVCILGEQTPSLIMLDAIFDAAYDRGMFIVLAMENLAAGDGAGIWYNADYPVGKLESGWVKLLVRYGDRDNLMGIDIFSRPVAATYDQMAAEVRSVVTALLKDSRTATYPGLFFMQGVGVTGSLTGAKPEGVVTDTTAVNHGNVDMVFNGVDISYRLVLGSMGIGPEDLPSGGTNYAEGLKSTWDAKLQWVEPSTGLALVQTVGVFPDGVEGDAWLTAFVQYLKDNCLSDTFFADVHPVGGASGLLGADLITGNPDHLQQTYDLQPFPSSVVFGTEANGWCTCIDYGEFASDNCFPAAPTPIVALALELTATKMLQMIIGIVLASACLITTLTLMSFCFRRRKPDVLVDIVSQTDEEILDYVANQAQPAPLKSSIASFGIFYGDVIPNRVYDQPPPYVAAGQTPPPGRVPYFNRKLNDFEPLQGVEGQVTMEVCIPMYNESARFLHLTLTHLEREVARMNGKFLVSVCLVLDGWGKVSADAKEYLARLLPDLSADPWWTLVLVPDEGCPSVTYCVQRKRSNDCVFPNLAINMIIKGDNRGKLNSHEWFFDAFCRAPSYEPSKYILLTDAGTYMGESALSRLVHHMEIHPNLSAVAGYMAFMDHKAERGPDSKQSIPEMLYRGWQTFDMEGTTLNFFGSFAQVGFLSVIPGPCQFMRTCDMFSSDPHELGAVDMYAKICSDRKAGRMALLYANMQITEDRVFAYTSVFHDKQRAQKHSFVPDARFYIDAMSETRTLLLQRRRWNNGAFATLLVLVTEHLGMMWGHPLHTIGHKLNVMLLLIAEGMQYQLLLFLPGILMSNLYLLTMVNWPFASPSTVDSVLLAWTWVFACVYVVFMLAHFRYKLIPSLYHAFSLVALSTWITLMGSFLIFSSISAEATQQEINIVGGVVCVCLLQFIIPIVNASMFGSWDAVPRLFVSIWAFFIVSPIWSVTAHQYSVARTWDVSWGNRPSAADVHTLEHSAEEQKATEEREVSGRELSEIISHTESSPNTRARINSLVRDSVTPLGMNHPAHAQALSLTSTTTKKLGIFSSQNGQQNALDTVISPTTSHTSATSANSANSTLVKTGEPVEQTVKRQSTYLVVGCVVLNLVLPFSIWSYGFWNGPAERVVARNVCMGIILIPVVIAYCIMFYKYLLSGVFVCKWFIEYYTKPLVEDLTPEDPSNVGKKANTWANGMSSTNSLSAARILPRVSTNHLPVG